MWYFKVYGDNSIYRASPCLEEYLQHNNNNRRLLNFKTLDLAYNKQSKHKYIQVKHKHRYNTIIKDDITCI